MLLMSLRSRIWLAAGALFFFINFVGAILAAMQGERRHAGVHAVLLVVGVSIARRVWRRKEAAIIAQSRELADGLTQLERSVAAVAIDVERIGEGQRVITRLFTENDASEPTDLETRGMSPQ
jgi:hypothetical protein